MSAMSTPSSLCFVQGEIFAAEGYTQRINCADQCLIPLSHSAPPLPQGEIFAAEGYAKVTGSVGVCIATSGPGATNLVTGLADALLDSVPLVAITGQVPRKLIGSDAFQETPIVEVGGDGWCLWAVVCGRLFVGGQAGVCG